MNFKQLAENLGLEEDEYLELARRLIQTCRSDLTRIESAARDRNAGDIAGWPHSIKGAAGNLGLMEIHDLAAQGEQIVRDNTLDQVPGCFGAGNRGEFPGSNRGYLREAIIRRHPSSPCDPSHDND
ncbi:MAG: Hpt domain-containing protein [Deltaproteobacteria bacterium]|nr:Hpt domain-containing protein [Deltaproteobacteria bacterium]